MSFKQSTCKCYFIIGKWEIFSGVILLFEQNWTSICRFHSYAIMHFYFPHVLLLFRESVLLSNLSCFVFFLRACWSCDVPWLCETVFSIISRTRVIYDFVVTKCYYQLNSTCFVDRCNLLRLIFNLFDLQPPVGSGGSLCNVLSD